MPAHVPPAAEGVRAARPSTAVLADVLPLEGVNDKVTHGDGADQVGQDPGCNQSNPVHSITPEVRLQRVITDAFVAFDK